MYSSKFLWIISSCHGARKKCILCVDRKSICNSILERQYSNKEIDTFEIVKKSELVQSKYRENVRGSKFINKLLDDSIACKPQQLPTDALCTGVLNSEDAMGHADINNSLHQREFHRPTDETLINIKDINADFSPENSHESQTKFNCLQPLGQSESLMISSDSAVVPCDTQLPILEAPTTCCQSGCANCVWLEYAEKLVAHYSNGGEEVVAAIHRDVQDTNLREYLLFELRIKKLV